MKKLLFLIVLTCTSWMLTGCVSTGAVTREKESGADSFDINLECKSAIRLGCRDNGRIIPWGAWAEKKGYDSGKYAVKEVIYTDNKATVLVIAR